MEINFLDIVQHVINIVVLYIILRAILYNPVSKFIQERKDKHQQQQDSLDQSILQAKELEQKNQKLIEQNQIKAEQLVNEKKAYAEQMAAKTIEEAKQEAARMIEQAQMLIKEDKEKAQHDFVEQTAELAITLAKHILEREVKREDNQHLIDDFFRKVG